MPSSRQLIPPSFACLGGPQRTPEGPIGVVARGHTSRQREREQDAPYSGESSSPCPPKSGSQRRVRSSPDAARSRADPRRVVARNESGRDSIFRGRIDQASRTTAFRPKRLCDGHVSERLSLAAFTRKEHSIAAVHAQHASKAIAAATLAARSGQGLYMRSRAGQNSVLLSPRISATIRAG